MCTWNIPSNIASSFKLLELPIICTGPLFLYIFSWFPIQRATWAVTSPTIHVYLWIESFLSNLWKHPWITLISEATSNLLEIFTRSGTSSKLVHIKTLQSSHHHFYFNRIPRLWNHLPEIDIFFYQHNQKSINCIFGIILLPDLTLTPFAPTIKTHSSVSAAKKTKQDMWHTSYKPTVCITVIHAIKLW